MYERAIAGDEHPVTVRSLAPGDEPACDEIIGSLPDYFGIEAGRQQCAREVRSSPGLVAVAGNQVVGFLTFRRHFSQSAEISWMAVHACWRRRGIGRQLMMNLCEQLAAEGVQMVLVLTVAASDTRDTKGVYASTRRFYEREGFEPLMEFPNLWPGNTAVLLMRPLGRTRVGTEAQT